MPIAIKWHAKAKQKMWSTDAIGNHAADALAGRASDGL
jgi:hypothetical protein